MNRVVHFEIHAANPEKLQKFYEGLFGWKFQVMGTEYGGYRVIMTGPMPTPDKPLTMEDVGINGGMLKRPGEMPNAAQTSVNAFVNIVGVANVDASFRRALELGGTSATEPTDVPNVGRIAYIKDPEFNIFGIITPKM